MSNYLLTIITVSRNSSSTISNTLHSLGNLPKLSRLEKYLHIVIDGLSTDSTPEIVEDWNYRSDFDKILISEADKGLYDAMNKGIAIVRKHRTKWFTFLNSDDQFNTVSFDLLSLMRNLNGDAIAFSCIFNYSSCPIIVNPLKNCRPYCNFLGIPFLHQATLYNSSIAETAQFDLRLKIAADYLFMINYVNSKTVAFFHYPLTIYDCGGLSSSVSALTLKLDYARALILSKIKIQFKMVGCIYQLSLGLIYDAKCFIVSIASKISLCSPPN